METIFDLIEQSIFLTRQQKNSLIDLCESNGDKIEYIKNILRKGEQLATQSEYIYSSIEDNQQANYVHEQNENDVIRMQIQMRKMFAQHT